MFAEQEAEKQLAHVDNAAYRDRRFEVFRKLLPHLQEEMSQKEQTQRGDGDITEWLDWYLGCRSHAIESAEDSLSPIIRKSIFWQNHTSDSLNLRQHTIPNISVSLFSQ